MIHLEVGRKRVPVRQHLPARWLIGRRSQHVTQAVPTRAISGHAQMPLCALKTLEPVKYLCCSRLPATSTSVSALNDEGARWSFTRFAFALLPPAVPSAGRSFAGGRGGGLSLSFFFVSTGNLCSWRCIRCDRCCCIGTKPRRTEYPLDNLKSTDTDPTR